MNYVNTEIITNMKMLKNITNFVLFVFSKTKRSERLEIIESHGILTRGRFQRVTNLINFWQAYRPPLEVQLMQEM